MSRGPRGRRGFRAERIVIDETAGFAPSPSSPVVRAFAELAAAINALPPERALQQQLLPDWVTTTVGQGAPNPLVRPAGRVWHGLQDSPDGTQPCLAERLRAGQQPVMLGNGRRNGTTLQRRQLRESLDGVLAIHDPRRTGGERRPWTVIDVPPGHHSHYRDQPLSDRDVQDWTVLVRAADPRADPRHADMHDDSRYRATDPAPRLGTWPRTEQP